MRVPIRIYNYVSGGYRCPLTSWSRSIKCVPCVHLVSRLPTPYDLRWPVLARPQRLASKATIIGVQDPVKALSQSQIVAISGE